MIELEGIERRFSVGGQTVHALRDVHLSLPAGAYRTSPCASNGSRWMSEA